MSLDDIRLAQAQAVNDMRIAGHELLSKSQDEDADLLGCVTDALITLTRAQKRLFWVNEEIHKEISS